MPLTRYQIRNEYGLADPELYGAADKDDPEALLEGVAMAGLVGVLRQLGDLAEFAAEIFHDLHEEVMVTAARGHGLMARVQQLEAEFPSIEKALLSQTNHSSFVTNTGVDWHPNLHSEQNLVARGDLPRFVMDSYEECRGPPRLFLLDKFDVAGAGACLKRYTDPSFFKVEPASSGMATVEIQREKKTRKVKKKGPRWRNGEMQEVTPTSHTKLQQLFLEERVENGYSDPARLVKLKRRQLNGSAIDSKNGKSYMEKFVETPSPEHKLVCETSVSPPFLKLTSDNASESGLRILEINTVSSAENSPIRGSACSSPNDHEVVLKPLMDDFNGGAVRREIVKVPEPTLSDETVEIPSTIHDVLVEEQLAVNGDEKTEGSVNGYASDDVTSEVDNYMDALATMESETETDNEYKPKINRHFLNAEKQRTDSDANEENLELQAHLSDSQSVGNFSTSDDGNSSFKRDRSSFSNSDAPSSLVENTLSDCDGVSKAFPSNDTEAETVDMSSNHLSVIPESQVTTSDMVVLSHDTCIQEDKISDIEDTSSSALLLDWNSTPRYLDPGASLLTDPSMGPKSETPIECVRQGSSLPNTEEKRTNLVDPPAVIPDISSAANDDFTNTFESVPQNELDDGDLNVTSYAIQSLSNISEMSSENESRDNSMNEFSHTQNVNEDSNQNLVDGKNVSLHISEEEKQLCSSAFPDVVEHDNPKADDAVAETGVNSEGIPPLMDGAQSSSLEGKPSIVDSSQTHSSMEQQLSDLSEDVLHLDPVTEMGALYSNKKSCIEEISRTIENEEICPSISHMDVVEGDSISLGPPSNHRNLPCSDNHVKLDDVLPETVKVGDTALPSAAVVNAVDGINDVICLSPEAVCSPPRNLMDLQESLLGSMDHLEKEVELSEVASANKFMESEAQKQLGQLDVAPTKLDLNTSKSVSNANSSSKIVNEVGDLSQNSLPAFDIGAASTPLELNDQESESKSPRQNHLLDNIETAVPLPPCNPLESKMVLEKSLKSQADQADVQNLHSDGMTFHPETPSEQSDLQADQPDVKCLVDEVSINSSNLPFEQVESLDHMDKERCEYRESPEHVNQDLDAPLEPLQESLASQPSTSEFSPDSVGQEVDNTNQALNPLMLVLPSFALIPEPAQVDLGDMPPLPPLPPMQWRMGKSQHTSLVSKRELVETYHDSIPPIQPPQANEKVQFELPASQSGIQWPENPFLPLTIVENKNYQQISEPLMGDLVQPITYSLQLPTMVNDANSQFSHLAYGGTQSSNPFLALPGTSNERPVHNYPAFEGEVMQSGLNPFLPGPTTEYTTSRLDHIVSEEAVQPLKQLAPETNADTKLNELSLQSSGEQGTTLITSMQTSRLEDEQSQHSLPMTKGETAWSSGMTTMGMAPDFEVGKPNGNLANKLPRPRNPLIDAVNAHGKSKLRKVTERVRPQIGPKVDERDSLLEQIRTKSFNLKPAAATRPSIQGPKTNLKVAAILEKANAIRQALAGSDEDDDDSWSDS
ncbi:hypothetical protein FNV43_RR08727 [Rhamnella rubrinervis]|uniref:Protein SCAR n=1 Tax=Rhamnella rubrinervis TaxID=2594499 RepID=A0A8K0H9S1_9ROSA|nr:hypothetical protein FNV43_RR08727 [Rhamnella rubrinervis]